MHKPATLALVLCLVGAARAADDEPPAGSQTPPAPDVRPEPEPEPVKGIRYALRLHSGRELDGIVRAKGVFERRAASGGYEPTSDADPEAGVRLWFPQRQDGFIFVRVQDVARIEELGELSVSEGRTISRARLAAGRRAEAERAQIKAQRDAEEAAAKAAAEEQEKTAAAEAAPAPEGATPAPAAEGAEPAPVDDPGRMAALLLRFPPTRWTPKTPEEVERRKVVLGLFPSDEEKEFLVVFDEWKRAYDAWLKSTTAETAGQSEAAGGAEQAEASADAADAAKDAAKRRR